MQRGALRVKQRVLEYTHEIVYSAFSKQNLKDAKLSFHCKGPTVKWRGCCILIMIDELFIKRTRNYPFCSTVSLVSALNNTIIHDVEHFCDCTRRIWIRVKNLFFSIFELYFFTRNIHFESVYIIALDQPRTHYENVTGMRSQSREARKLSSWIWYHEISHLTNHLI